jgi:hypothetical protein
MNHTASDQVQEAASDSRINRKFRTFLHALNEHRTPYCELPQHLPPDRVTRLQKTAPVDPSGVRTTANRARAPPGARANPSALCRSPGARYSTTLKSVNPQWRVS